MVNGKEREEPIKQCVDWGSTAPDAMGDAIQTHTGCRLLVASHQYDPADYIRCYDDFSKAVRRLWHSVDSTPHPYPFTWRHVAGYREQLAAMPASAGTRKENFVIQVR